MADQVLDEWRELGEDFKKLEQASREYHEKLEEVHKYQKECARQIQHQRYRMAVIKKAAGGKNEELREDMVKREVQLNEIQRTLPQDSGAYLKVILGNVNVSILDKDAVMRYKSEYEKFKLILSAVAFVFSVLNLMFVSRRLERIYLYVLVWYYCTLTIRESILIVNGSRIKGWWRAHHFISTFAAGVLLVWPEGEAWTLFRDKFMVFNGYLSVVQYLQFRYQQSLLYRLKALGVRHNMDTTMEGFHRWMWKGLSFLFPFLFVVYFFQLYLAYDLWGLSYTVGATWHVMMLSYCFLVLFMGNITTMLLIIPDKIKQDVQLKYKILSQRLFDKNKHVK